MDERPLPQSDSISEETRAPSSRKPLQVRPLSGSIGAEILGIDLSQDLDEATFAAVHRAFLDHLVVIFPDQTLTPEQQIRFARRFGPIMIDPFIKSMAGYPEILEVIKEKHERVAFGESLAFGQHLSRAAAPGILALQQGGAALRRRYDVRQPVPCL